MTAAVTDFSQFTALRRGAEQNDPETLRAVAGQFEALFIETLLKNMRDASLGDSLFESSAESGDRQDMYRGMLDRQLSVEMASGRGVGLADMLVRQLGGEVASLPAGSGDFALPASRPAGGVAALPSWSSPGEFARDVWPHAERAGRKLNVAPEAILAQAALESGWGKRVIHDRDGANGFNLFGIKAGSDWQGPSVTRPTLEFADGVARREAARFRAYPDVASTFDDYARLISEHPRYSEARNRGGDAEGFARALQDAGYATDPAYADKIGRILKGDTMREALSALKRDQSMPITGL